MEDVHQHRGGANYSRVRKAVPGFCIRSRSPQHGEEEHSILKKVKKRMPGCWTVVKQRGMNAQSTGCVTKACRKWRTSLGKIRKLKRLEASTLARGLERRMRF